MSKRGGGRRRGRRSAIAALGVAAAVAAGCSDAPTSGMKFESGTGGSVGEDGGVTQTGTGGTGTGGTGTGGGTSTSTTTSTGTGTGTGTGGSGSSGTTGPIVPCTGIDLLFVVDNSLGMADKQMKLLAAADDFVSMIAASVDPAMMSLDIGVITTDAGELVVPTDPMTMMPTTYSSGDNYMTFSTLMAGELDGALDQGENGSPDERPMQRSIEALTPPLAGEGGTNAGFVRDDSLLVIVYVTDEEDDHETVTQWGSTGDPPDWIEAIAGVKGGIRKDVVVLSIVGTPASTGCTAEVATRIIQFTDAFPHSGVGDACASEYGTFLQGQVTTVVDACNGFTPP